MRRILAQQTVSGSLAIHCPPSRRYPRKYRPPGSRQRMLSGRRLSGPNSRLSFQSWIRHPYLAPHSTRSRIIPLLGDTPRQVPEQPGAVANHPLTRGITPAGREHSRDRVRIIPARTGYPRNGTVCELLEYEPSSSSSPPSRVANHPRPHGLPTRFNFDYCGNAEPSSRAG